MINQRIKILETRHAIMKKCLQSCVDESDWHGVQDAASDLREIEAEIKGFTQGMLELPPEEVLIERDHFISAGDSGVQGK